MSNSTLSGNGASFTTDGGSILNYGTFTLENTILANSPCGGTLTDGGHNLDPGTSCGFGTSNNSLSGVDLRLGPLADNGGLTQTHALPEGGLAVDKGASFGATTDQRGSPLPSDFAGIDNPGDGSDIGAFELQATDQTAPRVSRVELRDNATGIRPGTNVRAFFSEAMMKVSINTTTVKPFKVLGKDSALDATVTYHGATNRAMLDPSAELRHGDCYRVVVTTGARDEAGNRLDRDRDPSNGLQKKVWRLKVGN